MKNGHWGDLWRKRGKKGGKRKEKEGKREGKGGGEGKEKGAKSLYELHFFWEHVHNVLKKSPALSAYDSYFFLHNFLRVLVKRRVIYFNKKALCLNYQYKTMATIAER